MQDFKNIASCSCKPDILSLVEPYSSDNVWKYLDDSLPKYILELYKPEHLEKKGKKNYGESLNKTG